MSDSQPAASTAEITITVKGPSELKLSITISPEKSVAELKETIASKSDVEKERQRLIYSGKVLKDEDAISTYKIQNGHTIHMVKGAPKTAAAASTSGTSAGASSASSALRLPQMGTGLNVGSNPIDGVENIHHGLAGFNPFAGQPGMSNMFDPNAMTGMMNSPEFLQSMADMMSRPEVLDQIIATNPQLRAMGPQVRQMMQSPLFRQMMSNPETLRMMMQMQGGMGGQGGGFGGGGFNPFGGADGGAGAGQAGTTNAPTEPFPNLFAPAAAAAAANPSAGGSSTNTPGSPGSNANPPANPFAALFGANPGAGAGAGLGGAGGNPFGGFDPSLLFGGPGGAGGLGGWGAPAAPRDERPPEEIYATQLGQLNAMGLWDAQKNIRALRSTGGNVEAAIELIFSGSLDQ
ncbi:ubiquilin [Kwoniella heveanensis BCC8398]|uniref:Ubiquilin n=1 Tax=Kwoniella heveanensis BCC8398 TaxID=1296120 RepID=A0A1B9GW87_9TREE|nr:ubiquilin [Kwoniella heveanensis BCC8398]